MRNTEQKKSLCEKDGHDYRLTTSDNYRICARSNCKQAQRKEGQEWVQVARSSRSTQKAPPAALQHIPFEDGSGTSIFHAQPVGGHVGRNYWQGGEA